MSAPAIITDAFHEAVEAIETKYKNLDYYLGGRDALLRDLRRELQYVNGKFRNRHGAGVADISDFIIDRLDKGNYVKVRPTAKEKYVERYPRRSDEKKREDASQTRASLLAAIKHANIIFKDGYDLSNVVEEITNNFLVSDDDKHGVVFVPCSETPIGFLWGDEGHDLNSLLTRLDIARHVDGLKTEVGQLAHDRALFEPALASAHAKKFIPPTGTKDVVKARAIFIQRETERIIDLYRAFETDGLRPGMRIPKLDKNEIEQEWKKFGALNGHPASGVSTSVNRPNPINDLSTVKGALKKFTVNNEPKIYKV